MLTQQPPPEHVVARQQGCPGPPHCAQTPLRHRPPLAHSVAPEQQGWPSLPQSAGVPPQLQLLKNAAAITVSTAPMRPSLKILIVRPLVSEFMFGIDTPWWMVRVDFVIA